MDEKNIKRIAVIGAGLMGSGVAVEFARFGYEVSIFNTKEASSKKALENIKEALDLMAETDLISSNEAKASYKRIRATTDIADAVAGADFVHESAPEILKLKQALFVRLDKICPPSVILATNTSSLRVTDISKDVVHPGRIVAAHYFQPPHFIPLVEVAGGEKTDSQVVEVTAHLLRHLRKRVVVIHKETPGFIGNRIQGAIGREIRSLVDDGVCTPEMIDDVISFGFGRRMAYTAYFKRLDLIGLDFSYTAAKERNTEPWKPIAERVESGALGMKSGRGFYDWPGDTARNLQRKLNTELIRLMKQDMKEGHI